MLQIGLRCPWAEEEKPLLLQFQPPFFTMSRLHTALLHKFIHVSVVGLTSQLLKLAQPQLIVTSACPVQLVSHNPTGGQHLVRLIYITNNTYFCLQTIRKILLNNFKPYFSISVLCGNITRVETSTTSTKS